MSRLYDFVLRDALKEELKPAVSETSGTGAPPYGDTPLIRELYGDWCDIMTVSWHYVSKRGEGTELLIRPRFAMPVDPNAGIVDPDGLGLALSVYPDDNPVHDLALTRDWATAFEAVKNSAFPADIALCICLRQQLGTLSDEL